MPGKVSLKYDNSLPLFLLEGAPAESEGVCAPRS
jgi:hypothetical protein